jgi:hypothetical protein
VQRVIIDTHTCEAICTIYIEVQCESTAACMNQLALCLCVPAHMLVTALCAAAAAAAAVCMCVHLHTQEQQLCFIGATRL